MKISYYVSEWSMNISFSKISAGLQSEVSLNLHVVISAYTSFKSAWRRVLRFDEQVKYPWEYGKKKKKYNSLFVALLSGILIAWFNSSGKNFGHSSLFSAKAIITSRVWQLSAPSQRRHVGQSSPASYWELDQSATGGKNSAETKLGNSLVEQKLRDLEAYLLPIGYCLAILNASGQLIFVYSRKCGFFFFPCRM